MPRREILRIRPGFDQHVDQIVFLTTCFSINIKKVEKIKEYLLNNNSTNKDYYSALSLCSRTSVKQQLWNLFKYKPWQLPSRKSFFPFSSRGILWFLALTWRIIGCSCHRRRGGSLLTRRMQSLNVAGLLGSGQSRFLEAIWAGGRHCSCCSCRCTGAVHRGGLFGITATGGGGGQAGAAVELLGGGGGPPGGGGAS